MSQLFAYQNINKIPCGTCKKKEVSYYLSWNHRTLIGSKETLKMIKYPIPHKIVPYQRHKDKTGREPVNVRDLFTAYIGVLENAKKYKHMQYRN